MLIGNTLQSNGHWQAVTRLYLNPTAWPAFLHSTVQQTVSQLLQLGLILSLKGP